jgi:TetR/AcrR family transcriptional regulator
MGIVERKGREKEHRKEEILDAAQKVFFEKGLSTATMDEIAETAELSKGTLYLYYKSKEDLYLGVMMRGMEALYEIYEPIVNSDISSVQKLKTFSKIYKDFFQSHRNFFRMFHFLQAPQFHKQVSEEMRQSCTAESRKMWDLVIGMLKRGMDDGSFRSDLNPIEVAIILWSNATSLLLRIDAEGEVWKERMNIDLEHTLDISVNLMFEAILTDHARAEFVELKHDEVTHI